MRIFQTFNLDQKCLAEHKERQRNLKPENWDSIREGLVKREYEVLENMNYHGGVPTSVIIGKEETKGLSHKEDFRKLADTAGIPFSSGEVYFGK